VNILYPNLFNLQLNNLQLIQYEATLFNFNF